MGSECFRVISDEWLKNGGQTASKSPIQIWLFIYYLFSFLNSHASLSSLKSFNTSIFLLFSFFIRVCNCLLVRKSYLERRQRGTSSAAKQREIVLLRQKPAIFLLLLFSCESLLLSLSSFILVDLNFFFEKYNI